MIMRKFYRAYFAVALMLGFHRHVYRVSNRWGGASTKISRAQYEAANAATVMLIDDGYHRCPSCTWATREENEHLMVVGSYCAEEHIEHLERTRRDVRPLLPQEEVLLVSMKRARQQSGTPWDGDHVPALATACYNRKG